MLNSILQIESQNSNNQSFGTGFVIDTDDNGVYILTCSHVVEDVQTPVVENMKAELIAKSDFIDMAVLYVSTFEITPLALQIDHCASRDVDIVGFSNFKENIAQKGHVQARLFEESIELHSEEDDSFYLARKIKANEDYDFKRGNSGSPVICKESGKVIAILSNKDGSDIAYAIEISCLKEVWKELDKRLISQKAVSLNHQNFYRHLNHLHEKIEKRVEEVKENLNERKREGKIVKSSPIRYYIAGALTVVLLFGLYYFIKAS